MKKIVVLAQTPPPFHGQSIMQNYLVEKRWEWCKKVHIRLDFSNDVSQVGIFSLKKILKIFRIILLLIRERMRGKIDLLYYPPCSPHKVPFYRDLGILLIARVLTKNFLFHFHSGGFNKLLVMLNRVELRLAKWAYYRPKAAIILLPALIDEVTWILPEKIKVIPNGIEDIAKRYVKKKQEVVTILFVGNLKLEKGIMVLIEAAKVLQSKGVIFLINVIGGWHNSHFEREIQAKLSQLGIASYINFLGVMTGEEKWDLYKNADIFCLPTYELESMPVTIIEAMMFELPVISTQWRAIPDLLENGKGGFLVPVMDHLALANAMEVLINDGNLRKDFGINNRAIFEEKFTIQKHLLEIENLCKSLMEKDN